MKTIILGVSVFLATMISAQNYPDYYPNNNSSSHNDYYDDASYFPDDYYYEYPSDYYTTDFYRSSYNDYRRSVVDVNWNQFFSQYRLSPWQIQQIMMLNDRYVSYSSWNSDYRFNPDRWYYDRFYALQNILGPQVFMVFQNNYYNGYNPIVYYQNYRRQHYVTNIYVLKRYRNINVNRYRVDRNVYHQNNPRNNYGFRDAPNNGNSNSGGFRNESNNSGFRNNETPQNNTRNDGFRNEKERSVKSNPNNVQKNNSGFRTETTPKNNGTGRNNDSGFRNTVPQKKIENKPTQQKSHSPIRSNSNNGGFRFTGN